MKSKLLLPLGASLLVGCALLAGCNVEQTVDLPTSGVDPVVLTDQNFTEVLASSQPVMIDIGADW